MAAQQVVQFADACAESAGESVSRVMLHEQRARTCAAGRRIRGTRGDAFAHSDFGWEEPDRRRVDGAQVRPVAASRRDAGRAIFKEKVREDRIRALGRHVVRWTWRDLDDRPELAARIGRALDHGAAARRASAPRLNADGTLRRPDHAVWRRTPLHLTSHSTPPRVALHSTRADSTPWHRGVESPGVE